MLLMSRVRSTVSVALKSLYDRGWRLNRRKDSTGVNRSCLIRDAMVPVGLIGIFSGSIDGVHVLPLGVLKSLGLVGNVKMHKLGSFSWDCYEVFVECCLKTI